MTTYDTTIDDDDILSSSNSEENSTLENEFRCNHNDPNCDIQLELERQKLEELHRNITLEKSLACSDYSTSISGAQWDTVITTKFLNSIGGQNFSDTTTNSTNIFTANIGGEYSLELNEVDLLPFKAHGEFSDLLRHQTFCERNFDELVCWPFTKAGTVATLPCFDQLFGIAYDTRHNATRECYPDGTWSSHTNYSHCLPLKDSQDQSDLDITTAVYFVGYSLSLFTLIIAIIIFISLKELRCLRNTIHTHLLRLYLYVLVVMTFVADNIKLRVYVTIGWGVPLIIMIVWALVKWLTHSESTTSTIDQVQSACSWVMITNAFDWIYQAPALLILVANFAFLVQIMWVLITKLRSATNPEAQQSRKAAKALLVLLPLLGLTYLLLITGSTQKLYEHLRALLLSTQGLLVGLLYCFLNGEVRKALRHRWNRLTAMGLPCCDCDKRGQLQQMTNWSPRSRTESIRLYTPSNLKFSHHNGQREFSTGEGGTLTKSVNTNGSVTNFSGPNNSTLNPRSLSSRVSTTATAPILKFHNLINEKESNGESNENEHVKM